MLGNNELELKPTSCFDVLLLCAAALCTKLQICQLDSCCVSMVNNTFMSNTVNVLKATQSYTSRSVSKKQKAPVSVLHVSLCPSIGSILGWQFIKSHLTEFWSDVEAELEDKEGMETGRDRNASAGCLSPSPCRALEHSRSSFPSIVLRTTAHSHTLHRSQMGS